MLRLVLAEIAHRRGRALALLAGIAVATAAFTVLTGASESSRLEVRGDVARHFRTAYDLLVRPPKAIQPLERRDWLIQHNYLAGIFGGISMDQLQKVRHAPGVEVAAPLAVYGYVMPTAEIPIPLGEHLSPGRRSAFRVRLRWVADRGSVRVTDPDSYVYVTRNPFVNAPPGVVGQDSRVAAAELVSPGNATPVCATPRRARSAWAPASRSWLWCWSTRSGLGTDLAVRKLPARELGARIQVPFPLLVAGVDPKAEAQLSGADRAVVSGRWFHDGEAARPARGAPRVVAPALLSSSTDADLHAEVAVEALPSSAADRVAAARDNARAARRALDAAPGTPLLRRTISAQTAYQALVAQQRAFVQPIEVRWTAGPPRYTVLGSDHVRAVPVKTDRFAWGAPWSGFGAGTGFVTAPVTGHDEGFRRFHEQVVSYDDPLWLPEYDVVGTFDPTRLTGAHDPDVAPLDPFQPAAAPAADPASAAWLRGQTLAPDGNMGAYLASAPTLLTTIGAGAVWTLPKLYGARTAAQAAAPISVIRVRVAGVHGADDASRERLRVAAQAIARRTGLQVDVTAGSSPTPVDVDVPASPLGRPAVTLREAWVKKGVATAILTALDRKSLVLFALVLAVCGLFCLNAAAAAVRSRATELGVLACVGWPRRRLFRLILLEVGAIGLVAGLAGTAVAVPAGALLGLPVSAGRALVAIPAATLLALAAGAVPAARAAGSDPLAAVRPAVRAAGSGRTARSLMRMAVVNLVRVPGRSVLGVLSLGVGVFALTVLLAVTTAFRGAVVGTVLGDAVAVEVRTADYVAVAATLVLGALAVADVLYLNLRDRSAEIATLRATGWRERHLSRLMALEGSGLGAAGGFGGAALGLTTAAAFIGEITTTIALAAGGAALLGTVVAAAASLPPIAALRRLPTATLLAEE